MTRRRLPYHRHFLTEARVVGVIVCMALFLSARSWLIENPHNNPWAPLDLRDPPGWTTGQKLARLSDDIAQCHAALEKSELAFTPLPEAGEGACRRPDRLTSTAAALAPAPAEMTCPVLAGFTLWMEHGLQPLAEDMLGSRIQQVQHLGTFSCRRIYGDADASWSEHATGNAIDIAGFRLEDGRSLSILGDWTGDDEAARFLRAARDAACESFGTVLSPDYNAAHADHFHLDQSRTPGFGACR